MKKKEFAKIILILVPLILFLLNFCIPSYARYKSSTNGNKELGIAKWDVTINEKKIDKNLTIDLFKTVDRQNVKEDVNAIAPGSTGEITLNIKNSSDVIAKYNINITESKNDSNIPILYSLEKEGEYKELEDLEYVKQEELGIRENNTKTIKIYWKWDFHKNISQNVKDNEIGSNSNSKIELTVNINVNQKTS